MSACVASLGYTDAFDVFAPAAVPKTGMPEPRYQRGGSPLTMTFSDSGHTGLSVVVVDSDDDFDDILLTELLNDMLLESETESESAGETERLQVIVLDNDIDRERKKVFEPLADVECD